MPDARPVLATTAITKTSNNNKLPPTFSTHKMSPLPDSIATTATNGTASTVNTVNNNANSITTTTTHTNITVPLAKVDPLERPMPQALSCPNLVMSVFPERSASIDYTVTPDSKKTITTASNSLQHLARHHQKHHMHLPPPPHSVKEPCRIGVLLYATHLFDRAARVMDHSISFCKLAALTLLHVMPLSSSLAVSNNVVDATTTTTTSSSSSSSTNGDNDQTIQACREWLRETEATSEGYGHHADTVQLFAGEAGLEKMLADPTLDAVYVIVPTEYHRQYALQCLRAQKHVLIKDFRSTPLTEFVEQIDTARTYQRFMQFSTMFDIQYNVHSFLETVNQGKRFGRIDRIKADLYLGDADLEQVGAHRPLESSDSCIHRLARYCVLMALLMTPLEQSKPLKAQIQDCSCNEDNVMVGASGKVWFDNGRLLEFHVGYSAVRTRQLLEVRSPTKYAVVTDFALAGAHGMHSFRVYDCQVSQDPVTGKASYDNVLAGEALDVPSGLPQHVMMWRGFAELCQLVQESGWDKATDATFLTNTALSLKATLLALEESAAKNNQQVPVVLLE